MSRTHLTVHQLQGTKNIVLYCGHCAGALHLALPIPAPELIEAIDQFRSRHHVCEERKK